MAYRRIKLMMSVAFRNMREAAKKDRGTDHGAQMKSDIDKNLSKLESGESLSPAADDCGGACGSCSVSGSCTYREVYTGKQKDAENRDSYDAEGE